MSILRPFVTISSLTFVSRILGFVRDILMAAVLGAGPLMEAFLVAFKLPNFFRRLFAEGAFSAAFVPSFSGMVTTEGSEKARDFAEIVFSFLFFSTLILTLIVQIFMPLVMVVIAPGFVDEKEKFDLAVYLTRITFWYLIFISLVSLLSGVLQSLNKFAAGAAAPILLNCSLIGAMLWLSPYTETSAHALAYGVAIAGVLQFLLLLFVARKAGMPLRLRLPRLTPDVRLLLKRMVPGIIGAGVVQINLWVDVLIGTLIPSAIAYLYFSDRINQFPLALIGTAIGTAMLPMLSAKFKQNKLEEAIKIQNHALGLTLFFALPACVALMIVAHPVIVTLFERGEFDATASLATAYALMAYAIGLPAFAMVKIFAPGFFATGDTATPVKIAVVCLVTNVVLNLTFMYTFPMIGLMPHIGLAFATSVSAWLNVYMLAKILRRENKFAFHASFRQRLKKILFCVLVMAVALLLCKAQVEDSYSHAMGLFFLVVAGMGSYFLMAYVTKAYKMSDLHVK